jgi:hypothetical protein
MSWRLLILAFLSFAVIFIVVVIYAVTVLSESSTGTKVIVTS